MRQKFQQEPPTYAWKISVLPDFSKFAPSNDTFSIIQYNFKKIYSFLNFICRYFFNKS